MSIVELCRAYHASTSTGSGKNWKTILFELSTALEQAQHPQFEMFRTMAWTVAMSDKPGSWTWIRTAIDRLLVDPTAQFDALPELPDYEELSTKDLVDKYESNDVDYARGEILYELKQRFPSLIQSDVPDDNLRLREKLKDVI